MFRTVCLILCAGVLALVDGNFSKEPKELRCFHCSSTDEPRCSDRFHSRGIPSPVCTGSCVKYKIQGQDGVEMVNRDCTSKSPTGCTTHDTGGIIECYCNTNVCNTAHQLAGIESLALFTVLTIIWKNHIFNFL